MNYDDYYLGMNLMWWVIWGIFLFWIFFIPYQIPGQRYKRESALDILKKRYARGNITEAEYKHQKKILEEEINRNQTFDDEK